MVLDPIDVLKVDKDCMDTEWRSHYVRLVVETCVRYGLKVLWVKVCNSVHKGAHYYIKVRPPIEPELANMLQYLLGDDCQRVGRNRARIKAGLNDWNKLFEELGACLRTIYVRKPAPSAQLKQKHSTRRFSD